MARGCLKVFVGMAAGVGKTYAMLREGQERVRDGHDVVVGWLETHGRAETAAQAEGLEVVPAAGVEYRGVRMREMDAPAVIARRPEVALIDELAHTNVPGMPHVKRYEDVRDILDAGIDVLSTVNVQHLESLNDHVFELTGVRVRETIPDEVLLQADELVIVDLTPDALQTRLRAGKVYDRAKVDQALLNFFTTPNLTALREVSLREVAGAIDEQLQRGVSARPGQAAARPLISERVMVLVRPEAGAQRLARRAWRTARRLGAELDVVCLPGGSGDDAERQRGLLRELAVTLGAHFAVAGLTEEELPAQVARLADERGVTRMVMRIPPRRGAFARLRGDLLSDLMARLEGVDMFLIADRPENDKGDDHAR